MLHPPLILLAFSLLSLSLGGCAREESLVTEARLRTTQLTARLDATDAQRFGYVESNATPKSDLAHTEVKQNLTFKAPAEWQQKGASGMRLEHFAIQGHDDLDCFVSQLGAGAGSLLMNVNRWRSQLGLPPIAAAEAERLPTVSALGVEARLVELESPDAERAMVVFAAFLADRSVFVKMQGKAASVSAELPRFRAFCQTLAVAK